MAHPADRTSAGSSRRRRRVYRARAMKAGRPTTRKEIDRATAAVSRVICCADVVTSASNPASPTQDNTRVTSITRYWKMRRTATVSYTHLRAHETVLDLVCRLLL